MLLLVGSWMRLVPIGASHVSRQRLTQYWGDNFAIAEASLVG